MSFSQFRTLTGDPSGSQHLVELRVSSDGELLNGEEHFLLLSLRGRLQCVSPSATAWILEPHHYAWVAPGEALRLVAEAGRPPAELLVWRFRAEALPEAMHALLPAGSGGLARPPAPLTPSMQALLLALRGCPVAPALRNLWGTGKLIELITLLLPPPVSGRESDDDGGDSPVAGAPRVLHPAIRAALDCMNARLGESIGLPEIAAAANSSPSHLSRLFTAEFGHGPTEHLRRLRLDHAAALLRSGQANVTEAAYAAGYQSLGQFSRAFSGRHGRPPSAFIRRS